MKIKYQYHTDAGHGWLHVKRSDLIALGIADKISGYSYQYLDDVYLEEDCDASLYLQALKTHSIQPLITEVNDGDTSRIRSFRSYERSPE